MLRTDPEYHDLMLTIYNMFTSKGLKATTMDSVAAALGISKRTLYEIFENKEEMMSEVFKYTGNLIRNQNRQAFEESDNVFEALVKVFDIHCNMMQSLSPEFFHDMDSYCRNKKVDHRKFDAMHEQTLLRILQTGVEQGLIKDDINLTMAVRLAKVQMESLKRMEDIFPPDITLSQALKYITFGLLRNIATPEGNKVLDNTQPNHNYEFSNINNKN